MIKPCGVAVPPDSYVQAPTLPFYLKWVQMSTKQRFEKIKNCQNNIYFGVRVRLKEVSAW